MSEHTDPLTGSEADWSLELSGEGPKYLQIANALEKAIRNGQLKGGSRLPDHRSLSRRLQVTTGTVSRGYNTAARRGLIISGIGRGTYVAPTVDTTASDNVSDLSYFCHSNPAYIEELGRILSRIGQDGSAARLVDYQRATGIAAHREAAARWFQEFCNLPCDASEVLLSNGSLHGLASIISILVPPGEVLLTEQLTYTGLKFVVAPMHVRMQGIAMDGEGLIPEALEEACRRWKPRALLCIPNYQNPTAITMPLHRREAIAEIAARYNVAVIEDDVYGPLIEDKLPLISSFIPSLGYVVSSASKVLSPGLRVGFVRVPKQQVTRIAFGVRTNFMTSPLLTEVLTRMIHEGTAAQMIAHSREIFRERLGLAAQELTGLSWRAGDTSPFLWLQLPAPWRSNEFAASASDRGVLVLPSEAFAVGQIATPHTVRVTLATGTDTVGLRRGLKLLHALANSQPSPGTIYDLP